MTNHLAHEISPYLLQHADNPVDWYPWGAEALEKARQEAKPIFLSIGYTACHWCHVMAHESFEDPAIAALLNASFISIKVDREERPDLDSIYMSFVVGTTGSGGWPLSVFLTPEGKPFYGGTYFPPIPQHNLPSFGEVLESVAHLWLTDRPAILSSSANLSRSLQSRRSAQVGEGTLDLDFLKQAVHTITQSYDWQNGGWGSAPKFPQPMLIEFLLSQAARGDLPSLEMVSQTLGGMAVGGMYDLLGGGFARYSVDSSWRTPHFEKMLYDNAQLARAYLHAFQLTGDATFRQVCTATLDFVLREMTHPAGGFFSSLDADSDGEEGMYYLWTPQEIRAALPDPDDADLFMAAYGVSEAGNFEGRNILYKALDADQLARVFDLDSSVISSRLLELRELIFNERGKRVRPATDNKVLVSWNALMLTAFAEAGRALDRQDYHTAATRNAGFILDNMLDDSRLWHSWREGVAKHAAYLDDYAGLVLALLSLYQTDPDPRWYRAAVQLFDQILVHFTDPSVGFFDTSDDHEVLLYRPKDTQDSATPSGNALALSALLRLAAYEGRSDLRERAETMLSSNLSLLEHYPSAFAQWLCAADFALGPAHEVAIMGDLSDPATLELLQPLWREFRPLLVLAASAYPPPPGSPALLSARPLLNGRPTAYVCHQFVCLLPVNDSQAMLDQLKA